MKLDRFEIKNFRSIEDIKINIKEKNGKKCLILVGKNEAGKSNILKAISAVFNGYKVSIKDQRKTASDDKYYIRAIFKLEENDFNVLETELFEEYNIEDTNIFQNNSNIKDFIQDAFDEIVLRLDIKDNTKPRLTYWEHEELNDKYKVSNLFYYSTDNRQITKLEGESNSSLLEPLTYDYIERIVFEIIKNKIHIEDIYRRVVFWEYSDSHLLPSNVNIENFKNNPDICMPLKNIFYLSNIKDIQQDIENAAKKDKGLHGFLDNISNKATKEFRKIWPDLKNIEFVITKDGEEFDIRIKEKEFYSNEDRSDGFKRFIAILLILSIESRMQEADNRLILFDEPDTFLYPTSARFLKEELLKISENSIVIYSTHSPFMIDNECIERHLVIERKDDISEIVTQDKSPFQEDELLKRAIGSNIFESIQSKNIIFEGYTDYKVFKIAYKDKDFKDCGLVYMGGIKEVNTITTMMMLTGKKFLIVSDSDETSKNKRKDFEKDFPDLKENWLEYDEVCDKSNKIKTLEDFYKVDYLSVKIKQYNENYEYDKKKSSIDNIDKAVSQDKEKRQEIKNALAINAKKENIKKEYFDFIKKIENKLDSEK
ncbi:AAA family ATPase [Campylobacter concisus]|uniref:ATP-dependent nuclease n=1 Tax=Campylobacter concisus TaxID=199 RepID=UPI0018846DB2|nr:AAA family ATPase [Campylobacter concisus]MBE9829101.1 AAA family ATPase [Campylobacter concisus]